MRISSRKTWDDEVPIVHEHPAPVPQAFDGRRRTTVDLLDPALDLVDQGSDLPDVAATGHHEGVHHPQQFAHGQQDRVLTQLGIGGHRCQEGSSRNLGKLDR